MLRKDIEIKNEDGLRERSAALFVQVASKFTSTIHVERGNKKINAKSIMGVLSLGLVKGDTMHLIIDGKDEREAMNAIVRLIEMDFEEVPES